MLLTASAASAQDIGALTDALANMPDYAATVTYAVTLPQADDDVVYTIGLQQPASADSYLINWSVEAPSGTVEGFTAWFDGHFYNFRNRRLQEHHDAWDPAAPGNAKSIQNSAQFASLLPSRLAMQLREVAAGYYTYTISRRGDELTVEAVRECAGEPDAELQWKFDAATFEPREFYADYNPGSLTGQQVKAVYAPAGTPLVAKGDSLSEATLRELYPTAFTRFRESQFAIENMRGEHLPSFSLPQTSGGRMTHRAADSFRQPTAIVLLDPEGTLSPQLVATVRKAVDRLPANADVIWACTQKDPDAASELLGTCRPGETALTGAASLAADCGAASLPVVIACGTDGRISDLIIGLNNSLETDVIRMLLSTDN